MLGARLGCGGVTVGLIGLVGDVGVGTVGPAGPTGTAVEPKVQSVLLEVPLSTEGGAGKAHRFDHRIALGLGIARVHAHHHALHAGDAGVEVARVVVPFAIAEIDFPGVGVLAELIAVQTHLR